MRQPDHFAKYLNQNNLAETVSQDETNLVLAILQSSCRVRARNDDFAQLRQLDGIIVSSAPSNDPEQRR